MTTPIVEVLSSNHDRKGFSSGNDALDGYLKTQSTQDSRRNICCTHVAIDSDAPSNILGYYTLSANSINLNQIPEAEARKLPKLPVPAVLVGRLAVSQKFQGKKLGTQLLFDAAIRTLILADEIGIYALIVKPSDASVQRFYEHFGFASLLPGSDLLYMPTKSIEKLK